MKKLLIFLMVAVPLVIIIIVNLTVNAVVGYVSIAVDNVTLDKSTVVANVDDKLTLNATIYPESASNKELIWRSDNEDVAKVDINGNVSFVGFGKGYITATSVDGAKMASCYFYVTDTKVHQVVVMAPKDEIQVGDNVQLTATVLPAESINKNVTYYSSDPSIATVDTNGLVKGVSIGYVSIIATAEDGGYSSYVTIAVINPVTSIVVPNEEIITSQSYQTIKYNILPADASNKNVTFEVSSDIATVNNAGVVSFSAPGKVTVTITTVDGGFVARCRVIYTAGYATSLDFETNSVMATIGDSPVYLNYTTTPLSVYATEVTFESDDEDVAYVDESGYLQFVSGGSTLIRARIEKSEDVFIEKTISVYVQSPAEGIVISDNISIAEHSYQLQPLSYPDDSTNTDYFYHSLDTSKATVSDTGLVEFVTDDPCEVVIDIYANVDNGDVKKSVTLNYTGGYAIDFELENDVINLEYGELGSIVTSITPSGANNSRLQYRIINQTQNNGGTNVVNVLSDGSIVTLGGGSAEIEVSMTTSTSDIVKKRCIVNVTRLVEDIDILLDLDYVNGEYVTALQTVSFSCNVSAVDSSNKDIVWSLSDKSLPPPSEGSFMFNYIGVVTLIATSVDGNCSSSVDIRYTGANPTNATITQIPANMNVGDALDIEVLTLSPSNAVYKNLRYAISNESTLDPSGDVIQITGNTLTALNGGKAKLTVYVASSVQLVYEINVIRQAQSIEITPSNITTTKNTITFSANVLPYDTTNKNIIYTVDDQSIATIEGNVLSFKKNGIVTITATSESNTAVEQVFTIEKVDKDTGSVEPDNGTLTMSIGDSNAMDLSSLEGQYESVQSSILSQTPIIAGETVVSIGEDDVVVAVGLGSAEIEYILLDTYGSVFKYYKIVVNVIQLAESIGLDTDMDIISSEYVTAISEVDLAFNVSPASTTDKRVEYVIINSYANHGVASDSIAYIMDNKLMFTSSGIAVIKATSVDGNATATFRIKYTGGDAVGATINVGSRLEMNQGDEITIAVTEWLPKDTINTRVNISITSNALRSISVSGTTIKALAGGESKITVYLSNNITKEITIVVVKKVAQILLDSSAVMVSDSQYTINPVVYPTDASHKDLLYAVDDNSVAILTGKTLTFNKAGTVVVSMYATDNSGVSASIQVTSTMGFIGRIELNTYSKAIAKNAYFNLFVNRYYPTDAENHDITFEIISQVTNDGSDNDVISLGADGIVTGLYGGTAVIRAYTYDYNHNMISSECSVSVVSNVNALAIDFSVNEVYQNSITTSKSTIAFIETLSPVDASNKNVEYIISDNSVATISNGIIYFLKEGKVTIKFVAQDNTNGEKYVIQSFYYTEDKIVDIKIKDSSFMTDNVIRLNVGENFIFEVARLVPADIGNISFIMMNKAETRIDLAKQVITFENNRITALHGGEATFNIYALSQFVGSYKVIVTRSCEDIEIGSVRQYTGIPSYSVFAKALPSDCSNKSLRYAITNNASAATIDPVTGVVTFSRMATIEITISSIANPSIKKTINLEYTKKVQSIAFTQTTSTLYVNGTGVDLSVISTPYDAEAFNVKYISSNASIATVSSKGKVIGVNPGEAVIVAYVDGRPDITATKTFKVIEVLVDIELDLDESGDKLGIGGYRVFANNFYDENLGVINTYQMTIKSIMSASGNVGSIDLVWKSSDEALATVDNKGLVTFLAPGEVTISVEPATQYLPSNPLRDRYTFNVVDGINIYKLAEFNNSAQGDQAIVLQADIVSSEGEAGAISSAKVKKALYGNGHLIDFTNCSDYLRVSIEASDTVVDNVTLRGVSFGENAALSTLEDKAKVIATNSGLNLTNVRINNCIIENAMILCEVYNAQVVISGCIIRNSFSGGLILTRTQNSTNPPNVTVKDCVFARSLFSSILFNPDQSTFHSGYESRLTVEGKLYIYNWLRLEEIKGNCIDQYVPNATAQVTDQLKKYQQYAYNYNGQDYYMLGILQLYAGCEGVKEFKSNGIVDLSKLDSSCQYTYAQFNGTVKAYGVPVTYSLDLHSLKGNSTFITPGSTYDSSIYTIIKQSIAKNG